MERFVPAEVHGLLGYPTVGLFIGGGTVFRAADAPPSIAAAKADDGANKPFGGWRVIPIKQHFAVNPVFGVAIGLAAWLTGSWRKALNDWSSQTFEIASGAFFALPTKTDGG